MILASDILAGRVSKPATFAALMEYLNMAHSRRRAFRMTIRMLKAMDDSALAEMGLTRREIKTFARRKIYRAAA